MRVQPITYCKCIWLERWCSLFIGGGRWQSSSDQNPCYFVIISITMYNSHMVFVKIWSHIFIYSKWSNLQLGDDTERDIIFSVFWNNPKNPWDFMASNSDQSLVLAFGGFFQFLEPTKPFGSLLRCCCCTKWLEQMISTVFWPIIFTLKHSRLFRTTCRFWGKQHMWSIQRKRQWRQLLPRQSPKQQLTLQEQNVSNRKRPKGTTSSRRRLIPANKTRRSGKGSASSQTPKKAILQMTATPCCPQVNGEQPFYRRWLPGGQGWHPTKGWNLLSPGRCLRHSTILCKPQWL